jgi:Domain of unknown function (DUF4293)
MWQRKQTLWLVIAIIVLILTAFIPYAREAALDEIKQVTSLAFTSKNNLILSLITSASIIACIFGIALFKNRNLQAIICLAAALLAIGIGVGEILLSQNQSATFNYSFGIGLPIVASLFCLLAFRGVKSDQKLVRSIDRLRD